MTSPMSSHSINWSTLAANTSSSVAKPRPSALATPAPTWRMPRPIQQPPQVALLAGFDAVEEILRRLLAHAFEAGDLGQLERSRGPPRRAPGRSRPVGGRALRRRLRCPSRRASTNARSARAPAPGNPDSGSARPTPSSPSTISWRARDFRAALGASLAETEREFPCPSRLVSTTSTTAGMTSPAFSIVTVSPMRMSFWRM